MKNGGALAKPKNYYKQSHEIMRSHAQSTNSKWLSATIASKYS